MSGPHPGPGGSEGPPDGDYASYVERLLQTADQQRGVAPAAAAAKAGGPGAALAAHLPPTPVPSTTAVPGERAAGKVRGKAASRGLPGQWILLLWCLLVLLMWFAPALLPLAIGCVVLAGVGYSLWKARRKRDDKRR